MVAFRKKKASDVLSPKGLTNGVLQPEMALWRWYQKKMALSRNDYFQFSTSDCLAIGGAPAYALKLDGDLTFGRSGISETFGNISLAGAEEFQIGRVEVWSLN